MTTDPVELTQDLIRHASVTPDAAAPITMLANLLQDAGFVCTRVDRNGIANLYARSGGHGPVLGFNGHVDVVPVGNPDDWTSDPFGAELRDGVMYGRGACDMKSGVAAFVAAAVDAAETCPGSLVLTITGDEEGDGIDGTAAILDWMAETNEKMDACIVGEPTCPNHMGEMIKIGRRGSMTARITARGLQGHSAYPRQARNPIHAMIAYLDRLIATDLDDGTDHFDRTTLQVTGFDTGNDANNVIPATCRAMVNIRFNDAHTGVDLTNWLHAEAEVVRREHQVPLELDVSVSGESFVTPPGRLSETVQKAVEEVTGNVPVLSTTGGTSDARFIRHHCPVIEVGLVGATMHQVDERVAVKDIVQLKAIYDRIIRGYFAK
ncbi:Succinyl-diaminopimelate desuccinylase [Rhodobacteraceae bacterium THAF1]|uniref:succinyl-diaminopimelate desuccinylase n=1 Tax=Palleronia sp. THAF1 TaxID=2587842 RepID=UPI000F408A3C|nr:succinyl-diaminopimelate desuccinylase [Palleronia sp. THAF1]QFU07268.1 Succinyl-diaminopimelate desuccinylase [Palleronia sp. THAF1]VDC20820.1 Succinyl-diaminopimelate desuccinylase [Rhodobacteraceae bacterium THAF1]